MVLDETFDQEPEEALEEIPDYEERQPEKRRGIVKEQKTKRILILLLILFTATYATWALWERTINVTIEAPATFTNRLAGTDIPRLCLEPCTYQKIVPTKIHSVVLFITDENTVCRLSTTEATIAVHQNNPLQELLRLASFGINNIPEVEGTCLPLTAAEQGQQQLIADIANTVITRTNRANYIDYLLSIAPELIILIVEFFVTLFILVKRLKPIIRALRRKSKILEGRKVSVGWAKKRETNANLKVLETRRFETNVIGERRKKLLKENKRGQRTKRR